MKPHLHRLLYLLLLPIGLGYFACVDDLVEDLQKVSFAWVETSDKAIEDEEVFILRATIMDVEDDDLTPTPPALTNYGPPVFSQPQRTGNHIQHLQGNRGRRGR